MARQIYAKGQICPTGGDIRRSGTFCIQRERLVGEIIPTVISWRRFVLIINLEEIPLSHSMFTGLVGDARDMHQFRDQEFDFVFSSSVIEHAGDLDRQASMANEIRRVGKRYFVQTPNRYFPLEPHFLFPYFQILPFRARVFLVRHFDPGWFKKIPDGERAADLVRSVRLLTEEKLKELFPHATLFREKLCCGLLDRGMR